MSNQCCKTGFLFGLAVAVFTWAFDFLVHGNLLMDLYTKYEQFWRPMEQMQTMFVWCIAFHLFMGMVFAGGFLCWRSKIVTGAVGSPECPYRKSMKFGFWVGLLLGAPQVMVYMWLPFDSAQLPILWGLSELVKWTLAGLLVGKLYQWKGNVCA